MTLRLPIFLILFGLMVLVPSLPEQLLSVGGSGKAWADDDDDGGDDDDDDDDGGRDDDDDDDGSIRRPTPTIRLAPPPTPAPPPPAFAPGEVVASGLTDDDLFELTELGFSVLSAADAGYRLAIPTGLTVEAARDIVRALPSAPTADFNHFYRTDQGFAQDCQDIDCPAREIINWPEMSRPDACGTGIRIGMIDTGINADHDTFASASLSMRRLAPDAVAYILTPDFNESKAVQEDLFLRMMDIVEEAGTQFAFPSAVHYQAADVGPDPASVEKAEKSVAEWRRSGRLPFPDHPWQDKAEVSNTLDYPPEGSAMADEMRDFDPSQRST